MQTKANFRLVNRHFRHVLRFAGMDSEDRFFQKPDNSVMSYLASFPRASRSSRITRSAMSICLAKSGL
jgi:hypothetical protein